MKLMAIDYGKKRVGIASTDEAGKFALPRAVWSNDKNLINKILKFKEDEKIEKIIIGESKNLDGKPNIIQNAIDQFINKLEKDGVEIILHPEIFTTLEAKRLQGRTEMTDASAAALILKSYLDSFDTSSRSPD